MSLRNKIYWIVTLIVFSFWGVIIYTSWDHDYFMNSPKGPSYSQSPDTPRKGIYQPPRKNLPVPTPSRRPPLMPKCFLGSFKKNYRQGEEIRFLAFFYNGTAKPVKISYFSDSLGFCRLELRSSLSKKTIQEPMVDEKKSIKKIIKPGAEISKRFKIQTLSPGKYEVKLIYRWELLPDSIKPSVLKRLKMTSRPVFITVVESKNK